MSKSIITVEDPRYVRLDKETGEWLPLYHKRYVRQYDDNDTKQDECFFVFNDIAKIVCYINGANLKLFIIMCSYVKYTKSEEHPKYIIVDDKFVKFCNENNLKGNLQYFKNRMYELEKAGLIVKHLPNVYYINPIYAFKGKLKTRNIIVGDSSGVPRAQKK